MKQQLYRSISGFALKCAFVITLLIGFNSWSQTDPVQATVTTSPPFLNYLSYYGDQNNHLQITLTNLDFATPPILARLRIRIQGSGWQVYTNPNATIGQPFLLEAGMPVTITGIDLLPYLQANNLINPNGVDLNNLPQGWTDICVDVIRVSASQQVLASNSCGFATIQNVQPPTPFLPTCGSRLDTTSMFENFQWFASNPPAVGMGIETQYDLNIYHWYDTTNFSPAAWAYNPVYFEPNINFGESFVVPMNQIPFVQGGKYVWTVTARVLVNGIEKNVITNNGVSAPCIFYYGEAQSLNDILSDGLTIDLFTQGSSPQKGKAWWTVTDNTPNQGLSNFDQFYVEYRKQPTGNEGFEIPWFHKTLTSFEHFIYQLEPSTTYEVKVSGIIGGVVGDPTPVETFTTLAPRVYNCGESDLPFMPTNYTALANTTVGTQVQIGQFMMTMTQVNPLGQTGHYSGKGEIPIAFLMGAKAKVTFDDILIDTEFRVREGRVDVITEGLNSWLDNQMQQFIDPYFVDGTIDSAYVQDSLAWVVVDGVAQSFVFDPPHYPVIVNDASGNQYTIYPNGDIIIGTYLTVSETWAVAENETVRFGQNANEKRGFDPMEHQEWYENYETMQLSDNTFYYVANKSMAKGETDKVNVQFPPNVTEMSFQLADGTPIGVIDLDGAWDGNKPYLDSGIVKTLNLPSFTSSGKYEVHAFANNEKVGQLNIHVYSKKEKEVIVVPIASTTITDSQIEAELDRTLGEANIEVTVTMNPPWINSTYTPTTTISLPSEVGMLNKYSDDMRDLRDAYFEANPSAPKNKYYLFLVNGFDDPNQTGYMVRGRSMGFVKVSSTQAEMLQTISHELGHGMGALEHTFKNEVIVEGSTNNLMDYSGETNLTKAQWKELRDLDVAPSLFDDVDDYMNQMAQLSPEVPINDQPIQYEYIEQQLVGIDQALMVNGGWFVKFKTPSRSKFTHFCLVNGKVVGLFQGTQYLRLSTTGYRSKPVQNETYDCLVTGQANAIRFLTTDTIIGAGRVLKDALIGSDTIQLIDKYVHADIHGFTYIDGVSCDEINGNYISGISNGTLTYSTINCPDPTPCNQTDVITIVDNDKQAVKNAFISIIESANGGFSWNPVRYIEGNNDIISTQDEKVITEKIRTLNSIRNNTVVGVVSLKGLLNNLYTAEAMHQMTSEVVNELAPEYPNKNLVLFLAHYIKQEENGIFTTTPYTCQRVSFATNTSDLIDASFTTLDLMNAPNATNGFFQLFTNIKKPYHIVNIYEKYDGSTALYESENLNDPTKDKTGLPFVKGAFHLVSGSRVDYEQAIFDLTFSVGNFLPSTGITTIPVIDEYITQKRQEYSILKNNFDANVELWEAELLDIPEYWTAGDLDFTNVREHHITKEVIWSEFIIKKQDVQQYVDLVMACGWSFGASNTSIYYEFDVMSNVIDPAIYGVIDALGVVPGIDFLADGAGIIYSTLRGNDENAVIYSVALAIPFAGAAIIKAGKKTYAIFAKRVNEQLVDISVKQMDEATEGWTRISNKVTTDNTKDQAVKELLDETADQFDDDAAKKLIILEEGVTNLTGKANLIVKLDAIGNLTYARNFVNNLDDVADAGLITRIENLPTAKLEKLDEFYSTLDHPSGFAGQMNYTTSKVIDGENITMTYRHGLPDMRNYSPEFSFQNGTRKFSYESHDLTGGAIDFSNSNKALASEFGIVKVNGAWVKDASGFVGNSSYRWKPGSQQFELVNANGDWVKYTWHHVEDGKTLIPVKTSIHSKNVGGFPHSGGKSIIIKELKELFRFSW